jgi:diguanylate cyclase (GGDEF)-like protein
MKSINDTFGHSEGDNALTATANILKNTFRESDVIARIGGDEFVVMIAGADEFNGCSIIGRLQENLHSHNIFAKKCYRLSLSAGIVYCDPGESPCSLEVLLKKADQLMYERKRGRTYH